MFFNVGRKGGRGRRFGEVTEVAKMDQLRSERKWTNRNSVSTCFEKIYCR
jgi:hypothetical protein